MHFEELTFMAFFEHFYNLIFDFTLTALHILHYSVKCFSIIVIYVRFMIICQILMKINVFGLYFLIFNNALENFS